MAIDINREVASFDLKRWLSFDGRIGRQTWWLHYVLVIFGCSVAIQIVLAIIAAVDFTGGLITLVFTIPAILIGLAFIWPALAGYIKRLHDRDMSGWWLLIAFIPGIGGLALLIICGFLKGTAGPNRFGPDPLAGGPVIGASDQATVITPRR
jgi:uncharacterized membrane protein YhaH (DUF805 family)